MSSLQKEKRKYRILRIPGKAVLAVLLLLLLVFILLLTPPVQNYIARQISQYLTGRLGTEASIGGLRIQLNGHITINDILVRDQDNDTLLSAGNVRIIPHWKTLLSDDLHVQAISISNIQFNLKQDPEGTNLDFILDAFSSPALNEEKSSTLQFSCEEFLINQAKFNYLDQSDSSYFDFQFDRFYLDDLHFATATQQIAADSLILEQPDVVMLFRSGEVIPSNDEQQTSMVTFSPDFHSGIALQLEHLDILGGTCSYQYDSIVTPAQFDPDHMTLTNVHLVGHHLVMNESTLNATIPTLSFSLNDFGKVNGQLTAEATNDRIAVSELLIKTDRSHLSAQMATTFDPGTAMDLNEVAGNFNANAEVAATTLRYFLSDPSIPIPASITQLKMRTAGELMKGVVQLDTLTLATNNSYANAHGLIRGITDIENLRWENLELRATAGDDLMRLLSGFSTDITLPPNPKLELITTGRPDQFSLEGQLISDWGQLHTNGIITRSGDTYGIDSEIETRQLAAGKLASLPWLGPVNATLHAKGNVGASVDLIVEGEVHDIVLDNKTIRDIDLQGRMKDDSIITDLTIHDPLYASVISAAVSMEDVISIQSTAKLDSFHAGLLAGFDSTLMISGQLVTNLILHDHLMDGHIRGHDFFIANSSIAYPMDSFSIDAYLAPDSGKVDVIFPHSYLNAHSNFDLMEMPSILESWKEVLHESATAATEKNSARRFDIHAAIEHDQFLYLLGYHPDTFSTIQLDAEWDEAGQSLTVDMVTGKTDAYGISLDTIDASIIIKDHKIKAAVNITDILYKDYPVGQLNLDMTTRNDTIHSALRLERDSMIMLTLEGVLLNIQDSLILLPSKLIALDEVYNLPGKPSLVLHNDSIVTHNIQITRDKFNLFLNGSPSAFQLQFDQLDIERFNMLIPSTDTLITSGIGYGSIVYRDGETLTLDAHIDSLSVLGGFPMQVVVGAHTTPEQIPFHVKLDAGTDSLRVNGTYSLSEEDIDAGLTIDFHHPEQFLFLAGDYLKDLKGHIYADASIRGKLTEPLIQGVLGFNDLELATIKPPLRFYVPSDSVFFDRHGISIKDFTLYDKENQSLVLNGKIESKDYINYRYDLTAETRRFTFIDIPEDELIFGKLVAGVKANISGDQKDTHVDADITIMNSTALTYVYASTQDDLLQTQGIIEFVDPELLNDIDTVSSGAGYDSLLALLPEFNLSSRIKIQDSTSVKIVVNSTSGDYIKATGGTGAGQLEFNYDRTGNMDISGQYTIREGLYRLSFYDLVKKNFVLTKGSNVRWSGNPMDGGLDIKATYTVQSNSIGLIGHEVGENEQSIYKRSLPYEVGIDIGGTLAVPEVNFTLDLPDTDRSNYPALASKLDRLKLPEFQSELNKQVFGLLALGGFLPESSVSDINSNQIATTALYNSVNSVLAAQLNRFAGQYLKGVNIDVGIQSYSDYSTPGGTTQTAMDFRVSKSILNERLSFEVGGDFDINSDQSGANSGDNYRGDIAIIYDLTGKGDKQLKLFNNESYDIVYQEIRNTGISLIFIREFNKGDKPKKKHK